MLLIFIISFVFNDLERIWINLVMKVFDNSIPVPSVQFLHLTSMVSICAHTQMENDHKGFEDLDASMVCVPWFVPRSHVAASNPWSNVLSQICAKLATMIFSCDL
jgi:hypothetical protein